MTQTQPISDLLTLKLQGAEASVDPLTGLIAFVANPASTPLEAVLTVPAAEDQPRREFLVTISERGVAGGRVTVFDSPEDLGKMTFLGNLAPDWTLMPEGFARLVPVAASRAHGNWSLAKGDGLYRCLARWSGADLEYSLDRRFSFGARITKTGANWTGIRVDAYESTTGARRLHLREYTGVQGLTAALATTDVGWAYDAWTWVEVLIAGNAVKARLYAEGATAPDWQVVATTTQLTPGAFGPGGFPALGESPVIDVRRLEFEPPQA